MIKKFNETLTILLIFLSFSIILKFHELGYVKSYIYIYHNFPFIIFLYFSVLVLFIKAKETTGNTNGSSQKKYFARSVWPTLQRPPKLIDKSLENSTVPSYQTSVPYRGHIHIWLQILVHFLFLHPARFLCIGKIRVSFP